jgi:hypothetical protein
MNLRSEQENTQQTIGVCVGGKQRGEGDSDREKHLPVKKEKVRDTYREYEDHEPTGKKYAWKLRAILCSYARCMVS